MSFDVHFFDGKTARTHKATITTSSVNWKINFIDESFEIYHINFGELMKNPLRTYIKLMNYLELTIDNNIIEKFREHISNYVDKQTFIEPFKRY